jgi:hypothetical protein
MLARSPRNWLPRWLPALFFIAVAACGAEPPDPCQSIKDVCYEGTTCWPIDMGGNFSCLPSKAYKGIGTDCALLVGNTTCGDGLICAPMKGMDDFPLNRCTTYCQDGTCPLGGSCQQVALFSVGPQVPVCILPPPTMN